MSQITGMYKRGRDDGFSLLEMVVAVAILLILAVVGLIVYSTLTDNAKQAAVESAATQVFNAARTYAISADKSPQDAEFEYNNSQVGNEGRIISEVQELSDDRLRVTAYFEDRSHIAIRQTPSRNSGGNPWEDEDGNMQPPTGDTVINMTYQCSETKNGYLGIVNISPDTTISLWETDNMAGTLQELEYTSPTSTFELRPEARQEILRSRLAASSGDSEHASRTVDGYIDDAVNREHPAYAQSETITNVSPLVRMDAGVKYSVSYDGTIETFAAPGHEPTTNSPRSLADCLVSIDHFGEETDLQNLTYLGGENLVGVPDNLPASVRSLRAAFENTPNFNDPNIRTWTTENVVIMRSMFYNSGFNQDISTWTDDDGQEYWRTDNLIDTRMMFDRASKFNNGSEPGVADNPLQWDMSQVINVRQMFRRAPSFNQDISHWDMLNLDTAPEAESCRHWSMDSGLEEQHKFTPPGNMICTS